MASKAAKARNQEAEKAAFELLKSKPAQWVIVGGVAIYLLPRAMSYLVDHIEQGTSYLLGAAWKGVTGKVDDAEASIEASGRYYRRQVDEFLGKKTDEEKREVQEKITTLKPRDQTSIEDYKKEMNIPLSAFFIATSDIRAAAYLMASGDWSYYGVRIINEDNYLFLLPVTISLSTVKEEIQTEDADEKGNCRSGWKRQYGDAGKFRELCTRTVKIETTIPPTLSGTEAKGKSTFLIVAKMAEGI